ncbi:MAG: Chemotaxis protein CheA [Syntrophorhabdus sp. PtaU1.Bin058]|nr:MAG: Chemotaxis protein CheA [Syntrophorhabdus sp. PtaU1.Bin058]
MNKTVDAQSEIYKEEARELLVVLEDSLLQLEGSPDDTELIGQIFRALHTIKGSGSMFGFDRIAAFTHEVETFFDRVRNREIHVSKEIIDYTLKAKDYIKLLLEAPTTDEAPCEQELETLIGYFNRLVSEHKATKTQNPSSNASTTILSTQGASLSNTPVGLLTYRIRFSPAAGIFLTGTNPLFLLEELHALGECRIIAQRNAIPSLEEINPEQCYVEWDFILTTDKGIDAIRDVFIFVEDSAETRIETIGDPVDEEGYKKVGEILVERGDIKGEDLKKALDEQRHIGDILVDKGVVARDRVVSALAEQEQIKEVREKKAREEAALSIRVAAGKLDKLVDLVGELVTVQAHLSQKANSQIDPELVVIAEEVERLTGELRDNTMSIRMVPIGSTFGRFTRLVRDLSKELGKEIVMTTEGAETELDKTVIERLSDPLVHLIRNSIDHGIELPAQRESLGKTRKGLIQLSARHVGAQVHIEITDDGAGLDGTRIREKAIEKGLIAPDIEISNRELFALIFAPGFSTAKTVSNISGRGVGMDVVRRTIDALRGQIGIESEKGIGTTITLRLPLTLAIIEGLLVEVDKDYYVLPLSSVEECIELDHTKDTGREEHRFVNLRGHPVPYIRLRERFDIAGDVPDVEQIVVTDSGGNKIGFAVDQVIGEHQTVIKTLSRVYKNADSVSGATILGDGTVALILDVSKLSQVSRSEGSI